MSGHRKNAACKLIGVRLAMQQADLGELQRTFYNCNLKRLRIICISYFERRVILSVI